jgi:hypothetical protein
MAIQIFTLLLFGIIIASPIFLLGLMSPIIFVSFYFSVPIFLYMALRLIRGASVGISFASTFVFFFLFFHIAPIAQLISDPHTLVNTLPANSYNIFFLNFLVSLFLITYSIFYSQPIRRPISPVILQCNQDQKALFFLLLIISIPIAFWGLFKINAAMSVTSPLLDNESAIQSLIIHKVIFLIPFLTAAIYISGENANRRMVTSILIIAFLFSLVLLTKNPFFERRNAIGPVYLTIFVLIFPLLISSPRRFFIFITIVLMVLFPVSSILTNRDPKYWLETLRPDIMIQEILGHMTDLHYDAWASFLGIVDYVNNNGFQYGGQLLSALFFFVPRSMWPDKAVASGELLGVHLSQNYWLWFTNISSAFPAEGYIDFGVIGVLLYAYILARFSRRIDYHVKHGSTINRISSVYYAFFLFFLLRGSLLSAFAYGVGAYIALNILPFLISKSILPIARGSAVRKRRAS